jgi:tetratricopeptide (TPR) repeat protein
MLGRADEAINAYATASGLPAKSAEAYLSFGNFLVGEQHLAEAIPCYRSAIEADPKSAAALSRLAWIYATHSNAAIRNGSEAVRLAEKASELTNHQDPLTENALAAAWAESGDFARAAETAEKAATLAADSGQSQMAGIIRTLLQTYRAGKPHRE